jgi:hypothetical protein
MATLMDDPVELPSSKTVIDRITISKSNNFIKYKYVFIERHLMNDPHDPFNRAPLTFD